MIRMKWFLETYYTSRFNSRHKVVGYLFSGRYKALIEDGSRRGYFRNVRLLALESIACRVDRMRAITINDGDVIGEDDGMDLSLLFCSSSG